MRILLINNNGSGFANYVELSAATTVSELFQQHLGSAKFGDYLIRVNRQPCHRDQTLQEDDRVSITPTKIEGADS